MANLRNRGVQGLGLQTGCVGKRGGDVAVENSGETDSTALCK